MSQQVRDNVKIEKLRVQGFLFLWNRSAHYWQQKLMRSQKFIAVINVFNTKRISDMH